MRRQFDLDVILNEISGGLARHPRGIVLSPKVGKELVAQVRELQAENEALRAAGSLERMLLRHRERQRGT